MGKFFDELFESVTQMDEIVRGERAPSREFLVIAEDVKAIRKMTGLSQAKFALLIHVPTSTVQNWEQGRRELQGPSRALMKLIRANPRRAIKDLAEA